MKKIAYKIINNILLALFLVRRYIQEQEGKDVFEYDIYGCPPELKGQLKIGDFVR